jgi:ubiquitin carboxyl-terminal hydrolase L3
MSEFNAATDHPCSLGEKVHPRHFQGALNENPAAVKRVRKSWVPLESNPALMNNYVRKLGASGSEWTEVWGLDEELLAFVPAPCKAVMLCFPITEASEQFRADEEKKLSVEGAQTVSENVYHIKQTIGNACGTIALIHTVLNNRDSFQLEEGKFWKSFYDETATMDNLQRADALMDNELIEVEHKAVAASGESADNEFNDNLHFIVFVEVDGHLYEMDGRKNRAINHGPCTDLLRDAVAQIRRFMQFSPGDVRYNTCALVPAQ